MQKEATNGVQSLVSGTNSGGLYHVGQSAFGLPNVARLEMYCGRVASHPAELPAIDLSDPNESSRR
jgi:hypothetical protein